MKIIEKSINIYSMNQPAVVAAAASGAAPPRLSIGDDFFVPIALSIDANFIFNCFLASRFEIGGGGGGGGTAPSSSGSSGGGGGGGCGLNSSSGDESRDDGSGFGDISIGEIGDVDIGDIISRRGTVLADGIGLFGGGGVLGDR